jgi:hypothetical protein
MDTRSMAVMGLIIGALTVPSVGIAASSSQQGGKEKQSQATNPPLDQNAELGKGHLGPHDGTPKAVRPMTSIGKGHRGRGKVIHMLSEGPLANRPHPAKRRTYRRPIWGAKALSIRESGKDRGTGRALASQLRVPFLAHRGIHIAPHACL